MEDKIGKISVTKITENKDGTCDVEFDVDKQFAKFYKSVKNKKRATRAGMSKFLLELLEKSALENN